MPTTSNFGWTTPADTDLVKDGAAAIRTLGNGIDSSFIDLKGGTTGQVLAKASNTDLDFTWSSVDPLTILDAKGDLITATAADTPARLAVGTNGQILTADSTTSTGLKWATAASGAYTQLATGSLSSTTTTISSISDTYNDLILIVRDFEATSTFGWGIRFNGDTANNYNGAWVRDAGGTGSVGTFGGTSSLVSMIMGNNAQTGANNNVVYVRINDYKDTNAFKTVNANVYFYAQSNENYTGTVDAVYRNTSAINAINIVNTSTSWSNGTYVLLGVK